jgi:TPR repeat protein
VPKDYVEAARWSLKAAAQADAIAQTFVGLIYAKGYGTPQNDVDAAGWFLKSATQGNADAQGFLASMYMDG